MRLTYKQRATIGKITTHVTLTIICLIVMLPVFWMVISSLKMPDTVFERPPRVIFRPTLHNYEVLVGTKIGEEFEGITEADYRRVQSRFPQYFVNTVIVAVATSLVAVAFGSMAGYAIAKFRFRGKHLILTVVLFARFIPPIVLVVPLYVLIRSVGLLDTHAALIFTYLSFTLPFVIWTMRSFFLSIPGELQEAAIVDGCTRFQSLRLIYLPLSIPGLVTSFIFCTILCWNEFLFAVLLTGRRARTLAPTISGFITDRAVLWGRLFAAGTVVVIPLVIFSFFIHRKISSGLTLGAVRE